MNATRTLILALVLAAACASARAAEKWTTLFVGCKAGDNKANHSQMVSPG